MNTQSAKTPAKFQVGSIYSTRSACNYDCVFSYKITKRTEKMIWIEDGFGKVTKRKVYIWEGVERCKPEGSYSMCPVIRAV